MKFQLRGLLTIFFFLIFVIGLFTTVYMLVIGTIALVIAIILIIVAIAEDSTTTIEDYFLW